MQYGLIGEKLSHSYSKIIHEQIGEYSYFQTLWNAKNFLELM